VTPVRFVQSKRFPKVQIGDCTTEADGHVTLPGQHCVLPEQKPGQLPSGQHLTCSSGRHMPEVSGGASVGSMVSTKKVSIARGISHLDIAGTTTPAWGP